VVFKIVFQVVFGVFRCSVVFSVTTFVTSLLSCSIDSAHLLFLEYEFTITMLNPQTIVALGKVPNGSKSSAPICLSDNWSRLGTAVDRIRSENPGKGVALVGGMFDVQDKGLHAIRSQECIDAILFENDGNPNLTPTPIVTYRNMNNSTVCTVPMEEMNLEWRPFGNRGSCFTLSVMNDSLEGLVPRGIYDVDFENLSSQSQVNDRIFRSLHLFTLGHNPACRFANPIEEGGPVQLKMGLVTFKYQLHDGEDLASGEEFLGDRTEEQLNDWARGFIYRFDDHLSAKDLQPVLRNMRKGIAERQAEIDETLRLVGDYPRSAMESVTVIRLLPRSAATVTDWQNLGHAAPCYPKPTSVQMMPEGLPTSLPAEELMEVHDENVNRNDVDVVTGSIQAARSQNNPSSENTADAAMAYEVLNVEGAGAVEDRSGRGSVLEELVVPSTAVNRRKRKRSLTANDSALLEDGFGRLKLPKRTKTQPRRFVP